MAAADGIISGAANPYNGGRTLSAEEIAGAKAWTVGKTGAEVSAAATQLGVTPEQLSQAGIINGAYGGGSALSADEISKSREWSSGKTADQVAAAGKQLGLNADQFSSVFGAQANDVTSKGYGTDGGLQNQYKNLKYDQATNSWVAPKNPAPTGAGADGTPQSGLASAAKWDITPDMTVRSQLQKNYDPNDPLAQQAQAVALQGMNGRGLVNSTIGQTAGLDAMYKQAMQVAQQDAATNASAGQFNAGQTNQFGLQGNQNIYTLGQQNNQGQIDLNKMAVGQGYTQANMGLANQYTQSNMGLQQGYTKDNMATAQGYTDANLTKQITSAEKINANSTAAQIQAAGINAAASAASANLSANTQLAINTANHQFDSMSNRTASATAINGWRLNNISDIIKSDLSTDAKEAAIGQITTYATDAMNLQGQWAGASADLISSVFK